MAILDCSHFPLASCKFQKEKTPDTIRNIFEREAIVTLGMTDVFSENYLQQQLKYIHKNATLKALAPGKIDFRCMEETIKIFFAISDTEQAPYYPVRTVMPFSVAFQPSFFSTAMIFSEIKTRTKMEIDLLSDFIHSKDLYDRVRRSEIEPDALLLSIPVAIKEGCLSEYSLIDYFPLCLMPQSTHQIISAEQCTEKLKSSCVQFHFSLDYPGTASVYFNEIIENRTVNPANVKLNHSEPFNIKNIIENGDSSDRAISWFPHYSIYENYHDCIIIDQTKNNICHQGAILFLHKRYQLSEMPYMLCRLIGTAWKRLLSEENEFSTIVSECLSNEGYAKSVFRGAGMFAESR